jgi:hypothetical protein
VAVNVLGVAPELPVVNAQPFSPLNCDMTCDMASLGVRSARTTPLQMTVNATANKAENFCVFIFSPEKGSQLKVSHQRHENSAKITSLLQALHFVFCANISVTLLSVNHKQNPNLRNTDNKKKQYILYNCYTSPILYIQYFIVEKLIIL